MQKSHLKFYLLLFLSQATPAIAETKTGRYIDFATHTDETPVHMQYGLSFYTPVDLKEQEESLTEQRQIFAFGLPVVQSNGNVIVPNTTLEYRGLESEGIIPQTEKGIPDALRAFEFGVDYKHTFVEGAAVGGGISAGSNGSKLFGKRTETYDATAFVTFAKDQRNFWYFMVNYSNHRPFLNGYVLPGAAFSLEVTPWMGAMVGFPRSAFWMKFFFDLDLEVAVELPAQLEAKATWNLYDAFHLIGRYDISQSVYQRAARSDREQILFYDERKAGAGFEIVLGTTFLFEVLGGYSLDRRIFEGKQYSDREGGALAQSGWFTDFNLRLAF